MQVESVSKVFPDEISRLFLPYMSDGCETLHRGLSQLVLMDENSFSAGNRPLQIFPMPSSVKLHGTLRGTQTTGLQ